VLIGVYAVCVVRSAWLCDDAYITFRTVENVVDGYGPRWNVADRVQTYTHPLWMWLLVGLRALTGELYYTALAAGLVLSLTTVVLLAGKVAASTRAAVVALALLACSRGFVDYSTSGLENPLSHLLLVAFVAVAAAGEGSASRLRWLALLAGLVACTRTDLLLLLLPALAAAAWRQRWLPAVRALAVGFAPLLLWAAFATFYYGFPHPNTAVAKLFGLGVPAGELWRQGLLYLTTTAQHDPATALGLLTGIVAAACGGATMRLLGLGVLLQVVYVARVGGDFMLGRFLVAPLLVAVVCLARSGFWQKELRTGVALVLVAVAALLGPRVTFTSGSDYAGEGQVARGIWDERGSYYSYLGLLSPTRVPFEPGSRTPFDGLATPERPEVRLMTAVGGPGFVGGRRLHILDPHVCDPLLARLPAIDPQEWRPGHTMRRVPEGYFESVAHDDNRIVHPGLAEYYDALRMLTRAPLFARGRLATILGFVAGRYDAGLQRFVAEAYRTPPEREVPAAQLHRKVRNGHRWPDVDGLVIGEGGIGVVLAQPVAAQSFQAALHSGGVYRFTFSRQGRALGSAEITTPHVPFAVVGNHTMPIPEPAQAGFDHVHVAYLVRAAMEPVGVIAAFVLDPPGN